MKPPHARLPLWADKSPHEKLETLRELTLDLYGYQLREARAATLAMLAAHAPADAEEAHDIERMRDLLAEHPHIFSPACETAHITASALIVDPAARRTLLHYHRRLGRWLQVGGHAEYETDFALVAMREAREETGLPDLAHYPPGPAPKPIDFDLHAIPESGDMPAHLHLDFRYILTTGQPHALAPLAGESRRFRWLGFAESLAMQDALDHALRRLLGKAMALFPPQPPA